MKKQENPQIPRLATREGRALLKYIDHLVASRTGQAGEYRLNGYRQDAMRCILVAELARLARNYNPDIVPEFMPFAMAMLKRRAASAAVWQGSAQRTHAEGAYGYASLDAPLDDGADDSDATMHDCLPDAEGAVRNERGRRLRRFYRVLAKMSRGDREILETLMDCDQNATKAARLLGVPRHVMRRMLRGTFARFRSIWAVTD